MVLQQLCFVAVKEIIRIVTKETLDGIKGKMLEKGIVDEDVNEVNEVNEEMERLLEKYMSVRDEVMSAAEVSGQTYSSEFIVY